MGRFVVRDTYFERAKKEGYRARSAYKLLEIQKKFHVVGRGDRLLDLGCAPGSWLQVLADIVGEKGLVVGIDLLPVAPLPQKNIVTRRADIREVALDALLSEFSLKAFDVVTCDIAPNLSGVRDVDNANIGDLYKAVRRVVEAGLRKQGNFVFKSFFLDDFKGRLTDLESLFSKVSIYKPTASRSVSAEVYLVCSGKK